MSPGRGRTSGRAAGVEAGNVRSPPAILAYRRHVHRAGRAVNARAEPPGVRRCGAGQGQRRIREPGEQLLDDHLRPDARQLRPQAEVHARAEGHVRVGRAGEVHPLGALEAGRVGVRRRRHRDEDFPAPQRPPVELQVAADVSQLGHLDGLMKRRSCSTAGGASDQSARRRAFCSGASSSAKTPPPIRCTVVSWPATRSRNAIASSSFSLSWSPSCSACTRAVIGPGRGWSRHCAKWRLKYPTSRNWGRSSSGGRATRR
jgi:hypothetical protein